MVSFTRDDLLALTPARFLAEGYCGPDGTMRPDFISIYPTAVSTQFLAAELSPQELQMTAEAVRQVLAMLDGAPGERATAAVDEALAVAANVIQQHSNEVMAQWLTDCAAAVHTQADLDAFLAHLLATERQYSVIAGLWEPPLEPDSAPASSPSSV